LTEERVAYWNRIVEIHKAKGKDRPSGQDGLAAILSIRRILGSRWQPGGFGTPYSWPQQLESRLSVIYEPNYRWLIHFAKKLEALEQILGHENVLDQFSLLDRYPSALMELDFGLKLKLAGITCKYDFQRGTPTPDLVAEIDGKEVDLEVTSLARPMDDTAGMEAMSALITIAIQGKCVAGGIWAKAPSRPELERIKTKAHAAVNEAKTERKLVEFNEPGVLSCVVCPEDMAVQVQQSPWNLGSFVMRTPQRLPKKDRLARTIEKKGKEQLSRGQPSVLVVYDRFSNPDEARGFVNEKEIELSVGAFSNLAGVILVCPFMVTSLMNEEQRPAPTRNETKENRTLVEYLLPDGEAEICTVWRHPMGKHRALIVRVLQCLEDFSRNLNSLYDPTLNCA